LYTDSDEVIFDAQRPVLFTAIADIVLNGDLVDRGIRLLLPAIPETERKPESVFWAQFEAVHAHILGALLDVIAAILRNLPHVRLKRLPRMADFALWITAAEPALGWKPGTFLKTYALNRAMANDIVLDASSVAAALQLLVGFGPWAGTAQDLLEKLSTLLPEKDVKVKSWPKSALALSNTLRRLAPSLRVAGIDISFSRASGKNSKRIITIRTITESSVASVASVATFDFVEDFGDAPEDESVARASQSVAPPPESVASNGSATLHATQCDAHPTESDAKNSNENNACDACDACDAPLHTHSNRELF
ncbi:MAG: hypothetical protein ACRD2L_21575, partial [Terriglobia bacterium]